MKDVTSLIAEMTPEEKVGQLLHMPVLEDEVGWPSQDQETLIKKYHIGAARIYGRRQNAAHLRALAVEFDGSSHR